MVPELTRVLYGSSDGRTRATRGRPWVRLAPLATALARKSKMSIGAMCPHRARIHKAHTASPMALSIESGPEPGLGGSFDAPDCFCAPCTLLCSFASALLANATTTHATHDWLDLNKQHAGLFNVPQRVFRAERRGQPRCGHSRIELSARGRGPLELIARQCCIRAAFHRGAMALRPICWARSASIGSLYELAFFIQVRGMLSAPSFGVR